jgi:hypothetical protein
MADNTDPHLALGLEKLQRLVEVGFTKTDGQNALILQRLGQLDDKHAELTRRVDELEERQADIDKDAVTNDQLKDRTRFILTIVTALFMVMSGIFGAIQFFSSP